LIKNNKKYFSLYLVSIKKEAKKQHPDEKNLKNFSSNNKEKLHPNVVAVLFVTVLTCCC